MNIARRMASGLRSLTSRMWKRQSLVFLFFLVLSASFWLFQALNESYEHSFTLPVEVADVPADVVLTTPPPSTVEVTLRDKGITLLGYLYGERLPAVELHFPATCGTSGREVLSAAQLVSQLRSRLAAGTQIVALRPDSVEYHYNHGRHRRLPVRLVGGVRPAAGYALTSLRLLPDSILVYGPDALLDTLRAVFTSPLHLPPVSDSASYTLSLATRPGVKYEPASVQLTLAADRLVEKRLHVPITGAGFPAGQQLRTFPAQAEVVCQVSMSAYRTIVADSFQIVVDHASLPADAGGRCPLRLERSPRAAQHVLFSPTQVDYVVETSPVDVVH